MTERLADFGSGGAAAIVLGLMWGALGWLTSDPALARAAGALITAGVILAALDPQPTDTDER